MRHVRGSNLLIVALVGLVAGGASSTQAEPLVEYDNGPVS